jgi:signal peptidase II
VTVVVLDQLTKWWALQALDGRTVDLVWTLRLRLVFNQGAAFGLGSRYAPLIALAALAVVGFLLRGEGLVGSRLSAAATGLVVGGAVGNLLDRVFRADDGILSGAVVDFVDLQWWPVFNVADVAITCGAVLLAVTLGLAPSTSDEDVAGAEAGHDSGGPGSRDGSGTAGGVGA